MTDYSKDVTETKKSYVYNYKGTDDVSLNNFIGTKKKPLYVTLTNTSESSNYNSSKNYSETITVNGDGHYTLYLSGGNSNKTVNLGATKGNYVMVQNAGKNKITAGDNGNNFSTINPYSYNTITAGKGEDDYTLRGGITKITDKGGQNTYYITGGMNTITDKGSEGSTFEFTTVSSASGSHGGTTTIKAGNGVDKLKVHNDIGTTSGELIINADLGKGDDQVLIDYKEGSVYNNDISVTNIKTGKGVDTVEIWAGRINTVDTGDGGDKVRIHCGKTSNIHTVNNINTGNGDDDISVFEDALQVTSTIKAGKGNDDIGISGGINTIYGEAGVDHIQIFGGGNTIYGGNDNIELKGGENLIYTSADFVTISNGENTIYTQKGGNKIFANGGINEIHSEKNKNYISLTNGTNTVYGGKGDTINANASSADNTIYANSDTINLYAGNNTVYTEKGGNKINILSTGTFAPNDDNTIYLQKGDNTVSMNGGESTDYNNAEITISAGKNTINLDEYTALNVYSSSTLKTAQTVNIKGHAYAHLNLGDGADIVKDTSDATVQNGWEMRGGDGNDKFYISNGSDKVMRGGNGNDYFEITNGSGYEVYGNNDNDTITLKSGEEHCIFGETGNDIINVNGGTNCIIKGEAGDDKFNITGGTSGKIYGGEGQDNFTITDGNLNKIYGGEENDTFNIKGGSFTDIYGQGGNDIYNLNMKSGFVLIEDDEGKNTVNVAKNFKGVVSVEKAGTAELNLNFDKSYKLTSSANVKNGVIKTNDSNITLYRNFSKTGDFVEGWGIQLITNVKDEISDKSIDDRNIDIGYGDSAPTYINIGGKNYTLNLDSLKAELVAWFTDHSTYADSSAVFTGGVDADINSLMAVYTADTQGCFVKA